ncbi:MAG: hypothetical protein E7655_05495 [Ruminococcaceae bacterium]|nr:hypothetical protein [Oscillospiraceae bacterium]
MTEYTYTEQRDKARPFRQGYADDLSAYAETLRVKAEQKRAGYVDAAKMTADRESYRRDFLSLLSHPLDEYTPAVCPYRLTHLYGDADTDIFRLRVEAWEGIGLCGLLFLPKSVQKGAAAGKKSPLVIAMHGFEGTPELASDIYQPNFYSHMVKRLLPYGAAVFVPQTLMWNGREFGPKIDRCEFDARLRMGGQSINALEIVCLRRCMDTFCAQPYIDETRIGMIGISYGAYFSLMTAACDTRIKAVYSSCFFNDRFRYPRIEMVYGGLFERFGDAETAALVCPRALYVEVGKTDCFFAPDSAEREFEKLLPYYQAANAEEKVRFCCYDGGHKLSDSDEGLQFFFEHLNR